MMQEAVDRKFLRLALENAWLSRDPNTQVGAVIVSPNGRIRGEGYNGFPHAIAEDDRLHDREAKLKLIVHGEMRAIMNAARAGLSTDGCTLYFAATDVSGLIWGGPSCSRCLVEILDAGITRIVSYAEKSIPSKWKDDLLFSRTIIREAQLEFTEYAA